MKLLRFDETEGCTTEDLSTVRSSLSPIADSLEAGTAAGDCVQLAPGRRSARAENRISTDGSRKASPKLRLLLVEDNPSDVELVLLALRKDGFDVSSDVVQTVEEFTLRIQANRFDVILADYNLPQWRGMEALEILRCEHLDVPLIVVTGYLGEEKAVECIKQGATDCVLKDRLARLPSSVRRALEEKRLRDQRHHSEEALAQKGAELARS